MSRHELVNAYITGTINRRAFVRGLTALGVSAGVAASYAVALQPNAAAFGDGDYYGDSSDGYYCLWAQRLDPAMRPSGEPKPVLHYHSHAQKLAAPIANLRLTASLDHIFIALHDVSGSIWQLEGF